MILCGTKIINLIVREDIQSAHFPFILLSASCGGSIVVPMDENRVINSPNYPEPYPNQAFCEWTVVAPRGHFVYAT